MHFHNIPVIYCHGSENYFLLIDGFSKNINFEETDYSKFTTNTVSKITTHKIDGVLFLLPSDKADARMRIFNKDGSEAEMCGNGFRCLGKQLFNIIQKEHFTLETLSGILQGKKEKTVYKHVDTYSVRFPEVRFEKNNNAPIKLTTIDKQLTFSSINIGNPQLVAQVNHIDINKLEQIGKKVNSNCPRFPAGNNVSFYKILAPNQIFVATYERGVGLTQSCGTAMAAVVALAANQHKLPKETWIDTLNYGGMVKCFAENNSNNSVRLLGNATFIEKWEMSYNKESIKINQITSPSDFKTETTAYQNFKQHIIKQLKI